MLNDTDPRTGAAKAASLPQEQIDALLDQIRVPGAVRGAALLLALAGLLVAVLALQNLTVIQWSGGYRAVPAALLAPSLASILSAIGLVRARAWAMGAAMLAGFVLLLGSLAFFSLMFLSGVFSPLGVVAVVLAVLAVIFLFLGMGPFARVAMARRKLREVGFDVDL